MPLLLKSRFWINLVLTLLCFYFPHLQAADSRFGGAEHIFIGDEISIYLPSSGTHEVKHIFHLPNGLNASYGDILSFGDFYEIVNQPIVQGRTLAERKVRFLSAFYTFAYNADAVSEANQILNVLHDEQNEIKAAMQRGEDGSDVLKRMGNEVGRKLNCITGGSCSAAWWLVPGRYLQLAENDFDHFGQEALIAYQVGHQVAIEEAIKARQTGDLIRLEMAYAMNAFAGHFLSDRFASGHMRVPRSELSAQVTPSVAGSVLATFMHAEDNNYGLHVHNARGDHWVAYGDRLYFRKENYFNRKILLEALQRSANSIFNAYQYGIVNDNLNELIPQPNELGDQAVYDISSLFYVDFRSGKIMRRDDLSNVHDKKWTANWWGWSTLSMLTKQYGLPPDVQARLARSKFADKAIKEGLITDKSIIQYKTSK